MLKLKTEDAEIVL